MKPLLVYGQDNGDCRLYKLTKEQFRQIQEDFEDWGPEVERYEIVVDTQSEGYVPDYVVKLAQSLGFEVDSI